MTSRSARDAAITALGPEAIKISAHRQLTTDRKLEVLLQADTRVGDVSGPLTSV